MTLDVASPITAYQVARASARAMGMVEGRHPSLSFDLCGFKPIHPHSPIHPLQTLYAMSGSGLQGGSDVKGHHEVSPPPSPASDDSMCVQLDSQLSTHTQTHPTSQRSRSRSLSPEPRSLSHSQVHRRKIESPDSFGSLGLSLSLPRDSDSDGWEVAFTPPPATRA